MNKLMTGVAIGAAVAALTGAGIWGVTQLFASGSGETPVPVSAGGGGKIAPAGQNSGVIDLICELHLDVEGQMALGIQGNEPSRVTIAQIDLDKKSGWYQGKIAISDGRGGSLTVQGNKFVVTRPAMFERFGVMITQEQFSLDRTTGDFVQSLGINDGRNVKLIKGTCAKVIKPPF